MELLVIIGVLIGGYLIIKKWNADKSSIQNITATATKPKDGFDNAESAYLRIKKVLTDNNCTPTSYEDEDKSIKFVADYKGNSFKFIIAKKHPNFLTIALNCDLSELIHGGVREEDIVRGEALSNIRNRCVRIMTSKNSDGVISSYAVAYINWINKDIDFELIKLYLDDCDNAAVTFYLDTTSINE